MTNKIFVLGDSRTGTTSLHKFLKLSGFKSIHYFFKESGVKEPAHEDFDANWLKLKTFIDESGFDAFSDYPLRTFYAQLFAHYPDAVYILTFRKDIETWRNSMECFFSKFNIKINIDKLTKSYLKINEEIRRIALEKNMKFCEICIDDDADSNGKALSDFLNLAIPMSLGWENKTDAYDNNLWSTRVTFFNTRSENVLDYVKGVTFPSKSMMSEHGWVFLINDTSNFMDFIFGDAHWTPEQASNAKKVLKRRHELLGIMGVEYLKFVIPEKAVVYQDKLPKIFSGRIMNENRPAKILASDDMPFLHYCEALLKDVRSFGQVYFRGDSHANWYGAFFIYQAIIAAVNKQLEKRKAVIVKQPFVLAQFKPFLAAYGGDIYSQLDKETANVFHGAWKALNLDNNLEYLVGYELKAEHRKAKRVDVEIDYLENLGERETFRFSHPNKSRPRAVIFRDSTAEYLVNLLAEHFSESLFIWHKGLVYRDVVEREQPDVVIHIMAERFLTQYTNSVPLVKLMKT